MIERGTLYICATPIGNMGDMTERVLSVLGGVDFIAAEDTRRSIALLNALGLKKPLASYHEHNKRTAGARIAQRLEAGECAAIITDAGMPCVSDPGYELVKLCAEKGIKVSVCPGASAVTAAVALSGIDAGRFVFEGFLPIENAARKRVINSLVQETRAVVIYESPKRVGVTLAELSAALGERKAAVIKEITKIHERTERGTLSQLAEIFEGEQKGEFVIVIEGAAEKEISERERGGWEKVSVGEHVKIYTDAGMELKDAMKAAAKDRGVSKSEIYAKLLEQRR